MKKKIFFILLLVLIALLLALLLIFVTCDTKNGAQPSEENTFAEFPSNEEKQTLPSEETVAPTDPPSLGTEEETEAPLTEENTFEEIYTSPILDQKITYTVTVLDPSSMPVSEEVAVKLMQNGQTVIATTTQNGVATFSLVPDLYTVVVILNDDSPYEYDAESSVRFSKSVTDVSVTLVNRPMPAPTPIIINAYSIKKEEFCEFEVTTILEGANTLEATEGERTYFLFTPTVGGQYKIRLQTDRALLLGYFGDANYPLQNSIAENLENNSFVLNVKEGNLGLSYLLGITSTEVELTPCTLTVTRIGEAIPDIGDLPFKEITAEHLPDTAFHAAIGPSSLLTDLDITDTRLTVVLNESDGFYHLGEANGPLVYLRITSPSAYLDALGTVAAKTGLNRYFYDENGVFTHKEQYNSLFLAYAEIADPTFGLTPLTEELAEAMKNVGEGMEWWKFASQNYLFGMTLVSPKTAWLFACCTVNH